MQSTGEEQDVIVRGSEKHKDYLRYQFGRIKGAVNGFETRIAVSGRVMLLVYVVYITVKAGVGSSLPADMPAWVNVSLVILDVLMLALQVLGLEGSVPGLRHLAEELEDKGKAREAGTVRLSSNIAQWLLAATAIDIVLQRNALAWHIADIATAYTNGLFVLRVVVIGLYLVAMAKLEHKGPKIISQYEARQKDSAEQVEYLTAELQTQLAEFRSRYSALAAELDAERVRREAAEHALALRNAAPAPAEVPQQGQKQAAPVPAESARKKPAEKEARNAVKPDEVSARRAEREKRNETIRALKAEHPAMTNRQIAEKVGCDEKTVRLFFRTQDADIPQSGAEQSAVAP